MTTEVAIRSITPWADWAAKMEFADQLVRTGFLPAAIKTAGQALAIIFTGQELGLPPMHALRSINVIQGKPSLAAELELALFKKRGGRSTWKVSDEQRAVLWLRHPNGDEHTETFTLEDAKRADLLGKQGWKNYPKAMLRARCTSSGLRAVAPDIIAGLYDPEELGADVINGEIVIPAPPPSPPAATAEDAPSHVFPPVEGNHTVEIPSVAERPPSFEPMGAIHMITELSNGRFDGKRLELYFPGCRTKSALEAFKADQREAYEAAYLRLRTDYHGGRAGAVPVK